MPSLQSSSDLIEQWMLLESEYALLANKTGATRLGFAVLLKFFGLYGRFPSGPTAVSEDVVAYLAQQVHVPPEAYQSFDWAGRTIKYHRAQIRGYFDFREATVQDGEALVNWLSTRITIPDPTHEALKEIAYARLRELRIEPPTMDRLRRLLRSAVAQYESQLQQATLAQLPPATCIALDALVQVDSAGTEAGAMLQSTLLTPPSNFGDLKDEGGAVRVDTVVMEVQKLQHLRELGLPSDLFRDVPPKFITHYRQRAATEPPREIRRHPSAVRYTLLDFRSNNALHQPIIQALDIIRMYQDRTTPTFPRTASVPLEGVIRGEWQELVADQSSGGTPKINKIAYEMCAPNIAGETSFQGDLGRW